MKNNTKQNFTKLTRKRGISLIVLVITIIIIIILSTAVIVSISTNNPIKEANDAVAATELDRVRDLALLNWSEAYLNGTVKVSKLKKAVMDGLAAENIDTSKYNIKVTASGVDVTLKNIVVLPDTFEGVEVYAKLYSYDDGSGSLLELSNSADTVTTEEGVTLAEDYGNIGNVRYKYIYEEEVYEQDGVDVYIGGEANSVMPPWLTLVEEKYGSVEDGYIEELSWYEEQSNIIKVNIANVITPKSTACLFFYCYGLQEVQGIENLDTSNVIDMSYMFSCCESLTNLDVSKFDTGNVTDMSYIFDGCSGLTSLDLSSFDTSNVTNMGYMFEECHRLTSLNVSKFDTSNVTNMSSMFSWCNRLTSLDVSKFDTSNVTDMCHMFSWCNRLTSIDVSGFDTGNVTDMTYMFFACEVLTSLDLSKFDTSNVTNMDAMFASCNVLTNLDLSSFDTSNVTNMDAMFAGCSVLTNLDLSSFDTSNVTDMPSMFASCNSLTSLDVSVFDTGNVTDMRSMFNRCSGLTSLDLSSFNTSNVTDMSWMFYDCTNLEVIYIGKDWVTAANSSLMFNGCKTQTLTLK